MESTANVTAQIKKIMLDNRRDLLEDVDNYCDEYGDTLDVIADWTTNMELFDYLEREYPELAQVANVDNSAGFSATVRGIAAALVYLF